MRFFKASLHSLNVGYLYNGPMQPPQLQFGQLNWQDLHHNNWPIEMCLALLLVTALMPKVMIFMVYILLINLFGLLSPMRSFLLPFSLLYLLLLQLGPRAAVLKRPSTRRSIPWSTLISIEECCIWKLIFQDQVWNSTIDLVILSVFYLKITLVWWIRLSKGWGAIPPLCF